MSTTIGTVEVPFVANIDTNRDVPVSEIKDVHEQSPIVVKHQADNERITIEFVISEMLDTSLTMQEQRDGIDSLTEVSPDVCRFDYLDWDGWLAIENVEFGRATGEPAIQQGVIEAIYLPYDEYEASLRTYGDGLYAEGSYL